jgi:hypothetical protein
MVVIGKEEDIRESNKMIVKTILRCASSPSRGVLPNACATRLFGRKRNAEALSRFSRRPEILPPARRVVVKTAL